MERISQGKGKTCQISGVMEYAFSDYGTDGPESD